MSEHPIHEPGRTQLKIRDLKGRSDRDAPRLSQINEFFGKSSRVWFFFQKSSAIGAHPTAECATSSDIRLNKFQAR